MLLLKFGRLALVGDLTGTTGQSTPPRVPAPVPAGPVAVDGIPEDASDAVSPPGGTLPGADPVREPRGRRRGRRRRRAAIAAEVAASLGASPGLSLASLALDPGPPPA